MTASRGYTVGVGVQVAVLATATTTRPASPHVVSRQPEARHVVGEPGQTTLSPELPTPEQS